MKTLTTIALLLFLLTHAAFAVPAKGACNGVHEGKKISMVGTMYNMKSLQTLSGTLIIDGREIAHFDGRDAQLNIFFRTAMITNAHGDLATAKLTNPIQKSGVITRLYVRSYGIDYRNIAMSCWTKY